MCLRLGPAPERAGEELSQGARWAQKPSGAGGLRVWAEPGSERGCPGVSRSLSKPLTLGKVPLKAAVPQFSGETFGASALHPGQNHEGQLPGFRTPAFSAPCRAPLTSEGRTERRQEEQGAGWQQPV